MNMQLKPAALAALVLLSGVAMSSLAQSRKTYIVQLKDEPAATYQGTVSGYVATQPAAGETFQARSTRVQAYLGYLNQKQGEVLSLVDRSQVLATYNTVFNGFAARLTDAEALALRGNAAVVDLFEDAPRQLNTISTPRFLGLTAPGGLWSQMVGGSPVKGENLVIGVVDGGIWPENPAFFDKVDGSGVPSVTGAVAYGPPPASFTGRCVAGEGITLSHCNNKLVGIKHFKAGFDASGNTLHWTDFVSGRDSVAGPNGHGSHGDHTASTAAGNNGPTAVIGGLALGTASGIAPRARVAAYKVCWTWVNPDAEDGSGSQNNCWVSDSVAALDEAVKDGVNVINFSIGGSQTSVADPVEQAFYRASLANVFVATSAGNDGPGPSVAHLSPWATTVAATTHDRIFNGDVTLGNGAKYTGASMSPRVVSPANLVLASEAGLAGANATALRLCFTAADNGGVAVLDPAKVAGRVVVCDRGTSARVDKSAAVATAGGVGMVLVDTGLGLIAEPHAVPTVHVTAADGAAIKTYAAGGAGRAGISKLYAGSTPNAPVMADFSSRGPNAGDANVLKPDVAAPGVDVIAQGTPDLSNAQRNQVAAGTLLPPPAWRSINGTSMASPHVAGLALLLRQAHPTWSTAAIKSALMTTSVSTLNDGLPGAQNGLLPWAQGAGFVMPNKATDPGLVYDAGKADWVKYLCKANRAAVSPASDCTTFGTLDETFNLNLPSITAGSIYGGGVTVTRRVTNVGTNPATYSASASVPNFTTVVTPDTLAIAPGETRSFTVKLTPTPGAVANTWYFGSLTWNDSAGHIVRSPVQARVGVPIGAPSGFTAITASGSRSFTLKTGISGRITARKGGLKDVTLSPTATLRPRGGLSAAQLAVVCRAGADTADVKVYNFSVPAGTIVARWAVRQADTGHPLDDNDMLVVTPADTIGYSGAELTNEALQINSPAAGSYRVCVHAYDGQPNMTHALSSWIVQPGDAGVGTFNVLVPSQVYAGSSATVGMGWSGLAAGHRYVGGAQWVDPGGSVQATTVLRVEPGVAVASEGLETAPRKLRTTAQ